MKNTEFKGTKEKWRVSNDFNEVTTSKKGVLEGSKRICKISDGFKSTSEVKANAQLIASAPEMLEAILYLKECRESWSDIHNDVKEKFEKAIQKAIG